MTGNLEEKDSRICKPKIYLAGPMTGYPEHNFPAFDYAKSRLQFDWEVISPADMDRKIGFDPTQGDTLDGIDIHEFTMDCIRRDTEAIRNVDALALLHGWERSKGARAEVMLAQWIGLPVYQFVDELDHLLDPVGELVVVEHSVVHQLNDRLTSLKSDINIAFENLPQKVLRKKNFIERQYDEFNNRRLGKARKGHGS